MLPFQVEPQQRNCTMIIEIQLVREFPTANLVMIIYTAFSNLFRTIVESQGTC